MNNINNDSLTWDEAKRSVNKLLTHNGRNRILADPLREIYDDQLHMALKDVAVKHFTDPDFYAGLEDDLTTVKDALIIIDKNGFLSN